MASKTIIPFITKSLNTKATKNYRILYKAFTSESTNFYANTKPQMTYYSIESLCYRPQQTFFSGSKKSQEETKENQANNENKSNESQQETKQEAKSETKQQADKKTETKKQPETIESLIEELSEEQRKKVLALYRKVEEQAVQSSKKIKELNETIQGMEKYREDQKQKLVDLRDRLKEELEEKELFRVRMEKEVENTKVYAISKFAKDLIEIPDNLERAIEVSKDLEGKNNQLYEGVKATRNILLKVLNKYGIQQINPKGEKFDPNIHEALFDYEDPKAVPGTVGQVLTVGYMISDRVLRPAKVGTIRMRD